MAGRIWNVFAYMRLSRKDGDKEESNKIDCQQDMIRDFILIREDL